MCMGQPDVGQTLAKTYTVGPALSVPLREVQESEKMTEEKKGPTLGVHLRESDMTNSRYQLLSVP